MTKFEKKLLVFGILIIIGCVFVYSLLIFNLYPIALDKFSYRGLSVSIGIILNVSICSTALVFHRRKNSYLNFRNYDKI